MDVLLFLRNAITSPAAVSKNGVRIMEKRLPCRFFGTFDQIQIRRKAKNAVGVGFSIRHIPLRRVRGRYGCLRVAAERAPHSTRAAADGSPTTAAGASTGTGVARGHSKAIVGPGRLHRP